MLFFFINKTVILYYSTQKFGMLIYYGMVYSEIPRYNMSHHTMCIRDLDKLNLIWWFNFRVETISPQKNTGFKRDSKIIIWLLFPRLSLNPWYTEWSSSARISLRRCLLLFYTRPWVVSHILGFSWLSLILYSRSIERKKKTDKKRT